MSKRKAPPPNPKKIDQKHAELMRTWYRLGVHYRMLGEIFGVATQTANDIVMYRNAYRADKPEGKPVTHATSLDKLPYCVNCKTAAKVAT